MKKYLFILSAAALLAGCKKWLNVQPESQVSKDELFQTEAGFQEALNGVYSRCAQPDIYGDELSFGFPDVLAQNYDIPASDEFGYLKTSEFDYTDPDFISRKDAVWSGLYNAIANCNLILANMDTKKDIFSSINYPLIRGEALALRAYLHFDLLRLFAPSYASKPGAKAIPYVTEFSNKVTPLSTVSEVLKEVIGDLNDAKALLKPVDPILSDSYEVGYPTDQTDAEESSDTLFFQNRRHRMNYYAVCATLARVYLYMGDQQNALSNALEVIGSGKFPWTKQEDFISADPTTIDRILYKELVFAWYIPKMETNLINRFEAENVGLFMNSNTGQAIYETGGVGAEDLRYKEWFKPVTTTSETDLYLQKYVRDDNTNRHYLMAPALRLSEQYYIAAECTYDSDPAKAEAYVDSVRFHRGIGTPLAAGSKEEFLNNLVTEARKEFYGEGQIFYMYKRLNRDIAGHSGIHIAASDKIFVMPLPNDEIEFGNR